MFKVTQRIFVNESEYLPGVEYQGKPAGISPRYTEIISNESDEVIDEATKKRGRKRKRVVARNVAITNSDKE